MDIDCFNKIKDAIQNVDISSIEKKLILTHLYELVDEETNVGFNLFWDKYPKKVGKHKTSIIWRYMSNKEKKLSIDFLPNYLSTCDMRFILMPENYLREKRWKDNIDTTSSQKTITKNDLFSTRNV